MNCDILNLEWASKGRDIDIVEPVLSYLELKYGLKIVRESILNAEYKLLKYKPKVFIISNEIGAFENVNAVKFASKIGIKVVTLVSEGDFVDGDKRIKEFFWGWNKEEVFYEDLHLQWSERNITLIHKYVTNSKFYNLKVSGATGFDRYKILPFLRKEDFLLKYKRSNYKKVIGLAAWGFDQLLGEYSKIFKNELEIRIGGAELLNFHITAKDLLKNIYQKIIETNPDILFILKHHPAVEQKEYTEFYELDKYPNTITIQSEENIADIINVSDIWIAYESTTCLEAWLLGKQTMLVNPLGGDFKRSEIYRGSPIKISYEETQKAIEEFYKNNHLLGFKELEETRRQIITKVIEWDDGKNHIRAAEYIYELFSSPLKKPRNIDLYVFNQFTKNFIKSLLFYSGIAHIPLLSKYFSGWFFIKTLFHPNERQSETLKYQKNLRKFYERNNIKI